MKLKLSTKSTDPNAPPSVPPTPSAPTPSSSGGGFKLKLKSSQPPTPAGEHAPASLSQPTLPPPAQKPKRPYTKKPKATDSTTNKRSAQDDISPAAKRPNTSKKFSIKLGNPSASTPAAKVKAGAHARKQSTTVPRNFSIVSRKVPPKRPVGVGYDSEASDAEDDPAIEQQFVLRMEPGRDCDYLRNAIANKTLGEKPEAGGAYVNLRFLDKDLRRALVTIDQTMYAAIMVDLPCIIEGMKSWDKRGWWKVADICQMLLVLGPTTDENTAKTTPLPREVDKHTYAYAHGLTPPMHWVNRRRFRKRASYKTIEHVDDEVERLLKLDQEIEANGGNVKFDVVDQDALDAQQNPEPEMEYYDDEEPSQYITTTEDSFGQAMVEEPEQEEEEEIDEDLEGMLNAALADEEEVEAPALPLADSAATLGAIQSLDTSVPPTPQTSDPQNDASSSSDDDEDEDSEEEAASPDTIDEDLVAQQAQDAQVRAEIEDLEKEVENARQNIERTKNPMLRMRAVNSLRSLESELAMKRRNFGMEVDEDEEGDLM